MKYPSVDASKIFGIAPKRLLACVYEIFPYYKYKQIS